MTLLNPDISRSTLDVRTVGSVVRELYITARPAAGGVEAVADMYREIAEALAEHEASIVQERLFATASAQPAALAARARAISHPVPPTTLSVLGHAPRVVGAQVHAIAGVRLQPLSFRGQDLGCTYACDGAHYVSASGIAAPGLESSAAEMREAFEIAETLLQQAGGSWHEVARTWLWADDILGWYDDLNRVRSAFFQQRGLFDGPDRMPASTGIGVSPAHGRVAMDLFAAWGRPQIVRRFHATGNQRSAKEYGSAFARSAIVATPAGETVYCSGTAAIDAAGRTCHVDDIAGQVAMTIENVNAVLRDMGCRGGDVVQAMAYCASPAVQAHFMAEYVDELPWPCLILPGDVCRRDLLFEVEVTAVRAAGYRPAADARFGNPA